MARTIRMCWDDWAAVVPVPPAVRVNTPLAGTAFFPGGYGLWAPPIEDADESVLARTFLVLLNNFGSEGYWESCNESQLRGEDVNACRGTWSGLRTRLREWCISEQDCFFSNAYVGLLPGDPQSLTKNLPGMSDPRFRTDCEVALIKQLSVVKPRVVLAMGRPAIEMFGRLVERPSGLANPNIEHLSFERIDQLPDGGLCQVVMRGIGLQVLAIALTHPSWNNQWRRRALIGGRILSGADAEHAIVRQAIVESSTS